MPQAYANTIAYQQVYAAPISTRNCLRLKLINELFKMTISKGDARSGGTRDPEAAPKKSRLGRWQSALPKALLGAAMVLAGAGSLLSVGAAKAANAYTCLPRTVGGPGGFYNMNLSDVGIGDTVTCADKKFTVNGFDFGGLADGEITFEWIEVDPDPGYLDDLFSNDIHFNQSVAGPATGYFNYSIQITDPSYYFDTAQLDTTVALSTNPSTSQTIVTKTITGPTGTPVLTSTDGSHVGPIFLLPDNSLKFIQVNDSWSVASGDILSHIQDTFTQDTPGPLPLLGAGAAFAWSRKLRSRVKSAATQA